MSPTSATAAVSSSTCMPRTCTSQQRRRQQRWLSPASPTLSSTGRPPAAWAGAAHGHTEQAQQAACHLSIRLARASCSVQAISVSSSGTPVACISGSAVAADAAAAARAAAAASAPSKSTAALHGGMPRCSRCRSGHGLRGCGPWRRKGQQVVVDVQGARRRSGRYSGEGQLRRQPRVAACRDKCVPLSVALLVV